MSGAVTIDDFAAADDPATHLIDTAAGLSHLPEVRVDEPTARAVGNGMQFPAAALVADDGLHRVIDGAGSLLAVYRSDGRKAVPEVVVA